MPGVGGGGVANYHKKKFLKHNKWRKEKSIMLEIFSNSLPSIPDMDVSIFSSICKSNAG